MPRTVEHEPLQKHTLFLYEGDFEKLKNYYPQITASVIVRQIVRKFIEKIEVGQAPIKLDINHD